MKFLIDQNVPRKVMPLLAADFAGSAHVSKIGFEREDDSVWWAYAAEHGYAILTKDRDFFNLSMRFGFPAKVVWLRVGNTRVRAIAELLNDCCSELSKFDKDPDESLLILP